MAFLQSWLLLLHFIALVPPAAAKLGHLASAQTLGSTPSPSLASFIATQHFQPCYNVSTLPSLLDGAVQAARLGSTSFKFALKQDMASMYPYNNEADPWPTNFSTLTDVLGASQVQKLIRNKLNTSFDSFTLWAYRVGAPGSPFCRPITPAELAAETAQLAALTEALMALPPARSGATTFWLESWENDWAIRCGNLTTPAIPPILAAFTAWLQARQDGVTQGRTAFCVARNGVLDPNQRTAVDCNDPRAVVAASAVNVFLGAEVNRVASCLHNVSCGNIVREVLPKVSLDYVSYSSYDSMRTPQLADALDLISAQHNRTVASPQRALFITEFGLPETITDPKTVRQVVDNVLSIARAKDLARVHYWQIINNEKLGHIGGNCNAGEPPNFDPATQQGFWTTLPNGSLSAVGQYLQDIIAGRQPMPPLAAPLATPILPVSI